MKTKVDVISGFLGAGKTTLIKKLLEEGFNNEKVVLIENEFGQVGIDGAILGKSNFEVRELNSGCICCTLILDFEKAIEEILYTLKPDRIIIEPSGVGRLSDVLKACGIANLKDKLEVNMLVAVVDVLKYQLYITNFSDFYENQIINAKTVILSRTRNAASKNVESVAASIRKLNSKANIITTPWDSLSAKLITAVAEQDTSIFLDRRLLNPEELHKSHIHHEGCKCDDNHHCTHTHDDSHARNADEVFDSWGAETPRVFSEPELKDILDKFGNEEMYGLILRGKGILQVTGNRWVQFDYVPEEIKIRDTAPYYTGRLNIIGKGLKKEALQELLHI